MVPFTRQLGAQSGVQLNPIIDNSERFVAGDANQIFAVAGRFERGRIDKAFRVNRGNLSRMLGKPTSATVNRLNETWIHLYEAFQSGAVEAIVSRLNVTAADLNEMYIEDGSEASPITTAASAPVGTIISVKHMECFNEGVNLSINAQELLGGEDGETPVATKWVKLKLKDLDGNLLYEFEGSLDPLAKDEFNNSTYLPNVAEFITGGNVVVTVVADAEVPANSSYYGQVNGDDIYYDADLVYFTEGGTDYDSEDYDRACANLKYGDHTFGYIAGGGTRSTSLLSKLIALGVDINKQVRWDIPGEYTPEQAITFYNSLNIDTHYSHCFWTPLKCDDPVNGGKDYIGTSGINIGLSCARNARTDANGIAPKNFPIAGKDYPLTRTGIVQTYTPTERELNDLAKARINPVLFIRFTSGPRYVFVDSLTGAKSEGDRKLIAVADMSSEVDDNVSAFCQEALQKPMMVAIRLISDFLKTYFEAVETAGWIKPSAELGNRSFVAEVKPNTNRPNDRVDVGYWLKYDGTARAIYIQQTFAK